MSSYSWSSLVTTRGPWCRCTYVLSYHPCYVLPLGYRALVWSAVCLTRTTSGGYEYPPSVYWIAPTPGLVDHHGDGVRGTWCMVLLSTTTTVLRVADGMWIVCLYTHPSAGSHGMPCSGMVLSLILPPSMHRAPLDPMRWWCISCPRTTSGGYEYPPSVYWMPCS